MLYICFLQYVISCYKIYLTFVRNDLELFIRNIKLNFDCILKKIHNTHHFVVVCKVTS